MARLPTPGSDSGNWGEILNDYLTQSLTATGTLKNNSVGNAQLADDAVTAASIVDGTISEALLDNALQTKVNSVGSGVPDGSITSAKLQDDSVISAKIDDAAVTASKLAPGAVTKATVGLGNVDNTSDASKPISTATQAALDTKALTSHTHTSSQISDASAIGKSVLIAADGSAIRTLIGAGTSNLVIGTTASTAKAGDYAPTKTDVGLSNVDNTSDAAKPISTATQTALNLKADATSVGAKVMVYNAYADAPALPVNTVVVSITGS